MRCLYTPEDRIQGWVYHIKLCAGIQDIAPEGEQLTVPVEVDESELGEAR